MNHHSVVTELLAALGGADNLARLSHCATRLRVDLHDETRFDKERIERLAPVVAVIEGSVLGQHKAYQLVVGPDNSQALYQALVEAGRLEQGKERGRLKGLTRRLFGNRD
ncbi:PTS sugar transporter subunit IIB [Zobellella denitrificans]|jgi:phosphotransferase system IIB component|uniref:PTS sugar transporter subunit IIB n=1 Tax=Zobellella taiwanensis TaxID=347535 RepID=A0A2P7RE42_9GAMM|nr:MULTISPECIES: PTS glucose/sucrose transporter subunit IIB [Zobellella]OXS14798.1 PTS sugar transporter subunit IIB [Zobellella denitrificans]PSJ48472.1 PTS sugar transporter subunit IIB [Zobellella taiwanensis]